MTEDTQQMMRALGRIEGGITSIHEEQKRIAKLAVELEDRVRKVERVQDKVIGWGAGAGAAAGLMIQLILGLI